MRREADPRAGLGRANLISYVDGLRTFDEREAYIWREGFRWRSRSYAALHWRILACAETLAPAGARPGDTVLIQGPDSPDWVEAFLGTLYVGAAAVPLETSTSDDFRGKVARAASSAFLIAPPNIEAPPGARRVVLGSWPEAPRRDPPRASPDADTRAEIVFTSGSTGDPKGVVLTHGNLVSDFAPIEAVIQSRHRWLRLIGRLPFLSTLPLSHMFGQALSVFLPTFAGLTIVLTRPRPRDVREAARRHGAWGLFTVPRLLELLTGDARRDLRQAGLLDRIERRQQRLDGRFFLLQALACRSVQRILGWRMRLIVVGGAALREATQEFWMRSGYFVVQGYGLTETAPIVSLSSPFKRRGGHVGRPLRGLEVKLGPDNEILVRGPNVTPGYLGGEASTADGWFRTGDAGEIDAQGQLRIRGRIKDVIVTAEGENVHPDDVARAFEAAPGVREVCVVGLPFDDGERVHAVLLVEERADAAAAVAEANRRLAPRQRVQSHTVWPGNDLPRTHTGKVRKGAVLEGVLELRRGRMAQERRLGEADPDGVRRLVAEVMRIPVEQVEPERPLGEGLGLNSLDLVELSVAVEDRFGVSLPEESLNRATVAQIERIVTAGTTGVGEPEITGEDTISHPAGVRSEADLAKSRPEGSVHAGEPFAPAGDGIETPGKRGALRMPRWARRAPIHLGRRVLQEILYRPFFALHARPRVRGLQHLRETDPPFLFVANHHSHFDAGLFIAALPLPFRGRVAPAMTTRHQRAFFGEAPAGIARYSKEWIQVRLLQLLFNSWPLPETAGVRESLAYAGELADAGFSLLIFPEGRHVPEGEMEPFRKGIGLFARELRAPVIPAYVEGTARILPTGAFWPRFGKARLTLGPPLAVDLDSDPEDATRRIEAAVRALRGSWT